MAVYLSLITIVVRDYDEAIIYYTSKLGFSLIEDTILTSSKRWVVISPGTTGCNILLAKAADAKQANAVGNQTGGRVAFFLYTDRFKETYHKFLNSGVKFIREPVNEEYGQVAVFADLYGNQWDLIEPKRLNNKKAP